MPENTDFSKIAPTIGPETRTPERQRLDYENVLAIESPFRYLVDTYLKWAQEARERQTMATPEGRSELANMLLGMIPISGMGAQVKAYHGSPTKGIKAFSNEFIGTGEGAQARGWGHYVSDLPEIAGTYMRSDKVLLDKKRMSATEAWGKIGDEFGYGYLDNVMRPGGVFNRLIDDIKANNVLNRYPEGSQRYALYENLRKRVEYPEGQLYPITIHAGKQPSEYTFLEWGKPITAKVYDKIYAQARKEGLKETADYLANNRGATSGDVYRDLQHTLTRDLSAAAGEWTPRTPRDASEFLSRAGISGMKYPAGEMSGVKSTASNYVIYDPAHITMGHAPDLPPPSSTVAASMGTSLDPHRIAQSLGLEYTGSADIGAGKLMHTFNVPGFTEKQPATLSILGTPTAENVRAKLTTLVKDWQSRGETISPTWTKLLEPPRAKPPAK